MPRLDEVTTQAYNRAAPTDVRHRGLSIASAAGGGGGEVTPLVVDTGSTEVQNGSFEVGWKFTIGDSDLSVEALRILLPQNVSNKILKIWDNSSNLITSVSVDAVADVWSEGAITPVILTSGLTYNLSVDIGHDYYRNSTAGDPTFHSGITYLSGVFNGTPGNYPNSTVANTLYGIVDALISV